MSAATLVRPSTFFVSGGFGIQPIHFKKDNGNFVVQRQAVFRSGTFRDSMGIQNTWEHIHMEQMVSNYNYLREQKRLTDVPVRHGHPGWLINGTAGTGAVIGYHTSLVAEELESPFGDGKYTFLLADYEILDPEAAAKYESGLFRNRSAEIIGYSTNDEAEFWPVYGGFAFVDIPAVEGLNFSRAPGAAEAAAGTKFIVMLDKEIPVTQPAAGAPAATQAGAPQLPFQNAFTAPAQQAAPVQQVPAQQAPAAAAPAFVFSVNGQAVSDFAAVQNHISTLELFAREQKETARTAFVDGLLQANVFMASEKDGLVDLAKGMSDEQWTLWTAAYSKVMPNPTLQQHGAPATMAGLPQNQSGAGQAAGDNDEIEIAKATVAMHRTAGTMSEDRLKNTASYKKLVAAGIEQA